MNLKKRVYLSFFLIFISNTLFGAMQEPEVSATSLIQPPAQAITFDQEEIIELDFQKLKEELKLSKKQIKKISKRYNKYLKKQLKIKEKIVGSKVKLSRLMLDKHYAEYEVDSNVNNVFSQKKKLFKHSVFFIKEIETLLTKEQLLIFRNLVPELYNPKL